MSYKIYSRNGTSDTQLLKGCMDKVTIALSIVPVTWFSIPLATNSTVIIAVTFNCVKSDYTASYGGYSTLGFARGSGNITKQGTIISDLTGALSGTKPLLDFVANTVTQSIDVVITGQLTTTTLWTGYFELLIST